jgi:UDP-2-acetamido-3-amino-2,3-dideoxy-glucuronate N-acetyltransferase
MKITEEITTGEKYKRLDNGAIIWSYSKVFPGAIIGEEAIIGGECEIHPGAVIGKRTTVGANVFVWDGVEIGAECFIGPSVLFTNERHPKNKYLRTDKFQPEKTIIGNRVTIASGIKLVCPITIGDDAKVMSGPANRDIKPGETYLGLFYEKIKRLEERMDKYEEKQNDTHSNRQRTGR